MVLMETRAKLQTSEFSYFEKFYSKKGNKFILCSMNADCYAKNTRLIFISYVKSAITARKRSEMLKSYSNKAMKLQ